MVTVVSVVAEKFSFPSIGYFTHTVFQRKRNPDLRNVIPDLWVYRMTRARSSQVEEKQLGCVGKAMKIGTQSVFVDYCELKVSLNFNFVNTKVGHSLATYRVVN